MILHWLVFIVIIFDINLLNKLDYFTNALSTILHKKGINIDCDANVHKNIGYQSQLDIKKVKEK